MATRLHWRKHYCGDFLGRVALWPRAAVGTYAIMLDTMFLNGPMSDEELDATLSTNTPSEALLIRRLLTRVEGGWIHHLVMESRERSLATSRNNIRPPRERAANASRSQGVSVHASVLASVLASDLSPKGGAGGKSRIGWTAEGGFTGITDEDRAGWAEAYPAVNLARQIPAMHDWLLSNPRKAVKSNWRKFITNWLSRQQDRGGDVPSNRSTQFETRPRQETSEEKSARIQRDSEAQLARIAAKRTASGANGTTNALRGTPDSGSLLGAS